MDQEQPTQLRGTQQEQQSQARQNIFSGYSDQPRPLLSYVGLVAAYNLLFLGAIRLARQRGQKLPERLSPGDIILLSIATHKLSRIIAKDWVISPLRAPFTTYQSALGAGEIAEKPRGKGLRRALGELLTCPYCMGPWVAAMLAYGLILAPRATRLLSSIFVAVAASDFLHHMYGAAKQIKQ